MFTYSSDARAGLDTAAQTLVRHGKLVLEARLNGNSFSVSYLERVY